MVNIELICNGLKNKADFLFGKGLVKKEDQGIGAKKRHCTEDATVWAQR